MKQKPATVLPRFTWVPGSEQLGSKWRTDQEHRMQRIRCPNLYVNVVSSYRSFRSL